MVDKNKTMNKTIIIKVVLFIVITIPMTMVSAQQRATSQIDLSNQQQSLISISALTAVGDLEQLKIELNKGLDDGLTINEIKEALVQLYAYCGFPRSLNSIQVFMSVLDDRIGKGIEDKSGKPIIVHNNVEDRYEQGRKVLEELTNAPQLKPAAGFGAFALRADAFLKEHLFADIFSSDVLSYLQRELVTIAALASMEGVEGQLMSHINIGKNIGITESQFEKIADLIDEKVSTTQANTVRKLIEKPLVSIIKPDMIVRVSEIEIHPTYLEEYKIILKEEAAASVTLEPGVVAIFPMYQQDDQTQVRIIEIYTNNEAYQSHLKTPHFLHYKTSTLPMVKALKLVDMTSIDHDAMLDIFKKLR
ncbi:carboxymuconolactone decarboxylase family protein [Sphingobacterium sp. ML3W]|uniref:carboxymuconolactone decarboxylase family protein n=1 Tax=Sphingobacterium sp. ML3W TaxID=1538644 RepID=UPI0009DEECEB|nr:carboxymuconolactone decarboxylase family protein [Sphingobacterium sp. ML3W]